jgi:hypothetical protein
VGWLSKANAALRVTGYPMVELMTLVETGTRALVGAVFGPPAETGTGYDTGHRSPRTRGWPLRMALFRAATAGSASS